MTLCAYESRSIHVEFARLENGRYKGSIVVRTLNGLAKYEIDLHCEHERDTATEALADAEKLAKEFEERELRAFAFTGPAGSSAQCVGLGLVKKQDSDSVVIGAQCVSCQWFREGDRYDSFAGTSL